VSNIDAEVIVIGGGFGGVVAAREVSGQGASTILLEARDRLGGRAWFKPDALAGLPLEMGGQWLSSQHERIFAEIERYGVHYTVRVPHGLADHWLLAGKSEVEATELPILHAELSSAEDLVVEAHNLAASADWRLPWSAQLDRETIVARDISLQQQMEAMGIAPSVQEAVSLIISPYVGIETVEELSWLHFIRLVAAAGGRVWDYIGGDSLVLDDGTTDLVERIAADVKGELRLDSEVRRVVQDDAGVEVVTAGGDVLRSHFLVCALPLAVLHTIEFEPSLDPVRLEASRARVAREGSKLWMVLRNVPDDFFVEGRVPGLHQFAAYKAVDDGVLSYGFGPPDPWLDGDDREAVEKAVRQFFPEAEVVASTAHNWLEDPLTLNSCSHYHPGEVAAFEDLLGQPEGRILFAGSDTSVRRPGYIEGAIETGFRAAEECGALLKGLPQAG
jgi:monoamine oxidase